jgi:hypothetical protein
MSCKRATLAVALAALPFSIFAAEPILTPVVVTASKDQAPPLATTVGAAGVQTLRSATSDTASLLRDVPGVSLYGAGGVSSLPSIHGLADDRLRIKVDGMDLIASCPNHMNPALSYLDPSNVGSLKVYAGITPVSVGGDSIGGTIIADTPAPTFAAPGQGSLFRGEAGAFYRSNGNARGANLSATYATESFSMTYSGATAESDNYDAGGDFKNYTFTGRAGHTLSRDEVGSTAYETRNHTLGVAFKGGNHLFEVKLGYQDLPYQLYPNQRMDMLDNEQKRLNLRYLGQFDWGKLEARAYHEKVDHFMDFGEDKRYWYAPGASGLLNGVPCSPIGAACAAGMPMYTEGKTTGASVKADIALTQQDLLRVGGEYQSYRLDDWWTPSGAGMWPNTFWNIRDGERDRTAFFGEWEKQMNPQWMTLAGLRFERVTTSADTTHGYNLNTFPTNPVPAGPGRQFQQSGSRCNRQQLGYDRIGALHPERHARLRIRLRPQSSLAEPVRTLYMVDLADGGADEQLRRRRQRLFRQPGSQAGEGAYRFRHFRLACGGSRLGIQGHALLHPRHRLHRRDPVERHDECAAQPALAEPICRIALHQPVGAALWSRPLRQDAAGQDRRRRIRAEGLAQLHQRQESRYRRRSLQHHAAQFQADADASAWRLGQRRRTRDGEVKE